MLGSYVPLLKFNKFKSRSFLIEFLRAKMYARIANFGHFGSFFSKITDSNLLKLIRGAKLPSLGPLPCMVFYYQKCS